MSIEKLIHRKASDYVAALQNPDAPELGEEKNHVPLETGKPGPVVLKPQTVGRGAGRPPIGGETATHHVHIRTTAQRKSAWVRAAKPKSLAEWATQNLDRAAKYEPPQQ